MLVVAGGADAALQVIASTEVINIPSWMVLCIYKSLCKGWGLSAKLGKHSAIWGKLGTALQAYTLKPCTKFPPNPTSI